MLEVTFVLNSYVISPMRQWWSCYSAQFAEF